VKKEEVSILVGYRLEQAHTALGDASYLLEGKRSLQSVVNRAYYAMFYAVLALLQRSGKVPSKHSGAIGLFDRDFVRPGVFPKNLSRYLHKAFELRQTLDYRVIERISEGKAEETLSNAEAFVKEVKEYLG
jgi:uncharacterized protein (UPF0332 family)